MFGLDLVHQVHENVFTPFLNATVFCLMAWFYSGSSMKSLTDLDRLIQEVLLQDDFSVKDLKKIGRAHV